MAKQLNIDLSFNADTSKAKAQIMDLQRSLDQLVSSTIKNNNQLGIDKEIKQAIDDTVKLKVALQAATDVNTGKLNLAKFSDSLKNGQMTLQQYAQHLKALGPEGEQAFLKLSKSIVSAETPMRQTNTLLNQMFVTLKNTAKWQISSSIIHGLQSGLASAFAYAKDLDQSLNNIRIVTGYSADEMAKFAIQANKAAQSLSATTTQYTDAALIYYQQGIRDQEEIAGRTETTIKLANVSRQSAEEVSSQMTAIWNNFDDGSHSLEYYADVITALGATTASSSQEIAHGMQQFAAVADTVGLSYEYAASALATIVATTRQSESTVGNGLRTIFSRLEGLKLGDTLEDGTDLNKYSAALATIGVNIKDTTGNLKDMDTILEETASKWDMLDKAQKVAFATTVGGVRQYTNLIALLDHWDVMQENINTARSSEGTLNEQAEIYAQSWEAAEKRVKAAAQQIYKDLIDEKFFIKLGDFFTTALNGVDNFINAIGGIPGVIAGVGVVLTTVFGKQLSESINSAMYEFSRFTGKAEDIANLQRQDALKSVNDFYNTSGASGSVDNDSVTAMFLRQEITDSYELQQITANLTEEQKAYAQAVLDTAEKYHQLAINAKESSNNANKNSTSSMQKLRGELGQLYSKKGDNVQTIRENGDFAIEEVNKALLEQSNILSKNSYGQYIESLDKARIASEQLVIEKNKLINLQNDENASDEQIADQKKKVTQAEQELETTQAQLIQSKNQLKQSNFDLADSAEDLATYLEQEGLIDVSNRDAVIQYIKDKYAQKEALENFIRALKTANDQQNEVPQKISQIITGFQDMGQGAVTTLKGVSQLAMGITSIKGAMDALNNTELTFFEKFSRVSMGLSIGISQFAAGLPVLGQGLTKIGKGVMSLIPAAEGAGTALSTAFGASVGPIAMAIAAIVALTAIIGGLKLAWENLTPEGKLSVATKEAEKSKKAYEDATNAVIEFKSTYKDWSSLYEKTKELKIGTEEYTEAMLEANKAASDMIEKYNLIADQDWHFDEKGNYVIEESAYQKQRLSQEKEAVTNFDNQINLNNQKITNDANALATSRGQAISANEGLYQAYSAKQVEEMARALAAGKTSIEEITTNVKNAGIQSSKYFADGIQELANEINNVKAQNKNYETQKELSQARVELGENYKDELEPLLQKNLNRYDENNGQIDAKKISNTYNHVMEDILGSLTSKDISDEAKAQLGYAISDFLLGGSEKIDLSSIDTSKWGTEFTDKINLFSAEVENAINENAKNISSEQLVQNFQDINDIIKELGDGNSLSADSYNKLTKAQKEYFKDMGDGTYFLIDTAEDFVNLIKGNALSDSLTSLEGIRQKQDVASHISDRALSGEAESYLWNTKVTTPDAGKAEQQVDALQAVGADTSQWEEKISSNTMKPEDYAKLTEEVYKYKDSIIALAQEKDSLNSQEQTVLNNLATQADSLSQLQNYMELSQGNLESYSIGLVNLGSQYDNCSDEVKNFKNALETNDAQLIENAASTLTLAIRTGEIAKKYDIDSKELESLSKVLKDAGSTIKGFSDDIKTNSKECVEIAKDINRFDKAVVSVNKNYKNWSNALKSGNLQDIAASIDEMEEAYGNLLDLDGSQFSANFLNSTKNLELMKEAINGNEQAYQDLLNIANEDLTANITKSLNSGQLENFEAALGRVRGQMNMMGFEGQQAGADLAAALGDLPNPALDNTSFLNALTDMVNAAHMTQEQATNYLSSMGVDAEIETVTDEKPAVKTVNSLEPDITYDTVTNPSIADDGTLSTVDVQVPKIIYKAHPEQIEDTTVGAGFSLKVTSANKSSGGGTKLKNSSHGSGNGKSKGSGGGGGGGGGSTPKPAKKKDVTKKSDEKDVDRYIKINQELAQKEHENTLLNTKLNSTSGQSAIKVMKEQLGILKEQERLYKELAKEAEDYRVKDLEKLKKDFSDLDFQIDPSDGMLINYETLLKEQTDLYNKVYNEWTDKIIAAEKEYNDQIAILGEAATEEALKPWADAIEKIKEDSKEPLRLAQEQYDLFKKDTDKYNESVEEARKGEEQAAAKALERYNQELDIIAKGVELKIKVDDADLQYLEFLLKQIGEGADKALDRMSNYTKSIDDNMSKIDKYQEGLYEVLDHAGIDMEDLLDGDIDDLGSFNENDLAKIEEYRDGLIACGEQLMELRKTLLNEVSEAFDEFNSDLDRTVSKIEHLKSFTQTYKNLIDIVGKDVLDPMGKTTIMLAETTYTQAKANTEALKRELDFQLSAVEDYNRVIAELEADNANGEHDDTIKEFKKQLKEAEDAYQSAQENWLSSWEETVQAAADVYEAQLTQIVEDFGKSISGLAGSLEDLSQQYERNKDLQDMYVDDYEKIYQLSKLNRDINKSIDDTDNIRSKQRLRELQEQINDLQASENEMSEYELENLRRRYELELASLQLEEAKDAKSQVRMMRDNEGNWGYIYTADETQVEEAEQNYEDKLYAMQKANTEYIESLESEILRIEQEWADALAEIKVQDYASYEEYMAAVDACNDYYTKKLDITYDQMSIVLGENKRLYDEDWARYSAMTGYKISEDERFLDKFTETNLSMITGYQTIEDATEAYHTAVGDSVDSATTRMSDAYQQWYENTNNALELGGTSIQGYADDVNEAVNGDGGIVDQTIDAQEAVDEMANEYDSAFTDIINYAEDFAMDFDSVIEGIIDGCNKAIEAIMRLLEAMAEAEDEDFDAEGPVEPDDYEWVNLKEGTGDYDWRYRSKSTGKDKIGDFEADYTINGTTYRANYKTDASGSLLASEQNSEHNGKYGMINERVVNSIDKLDKTMNQMIDDTPGYVIASGASGMYTGDWGDNSGKIGVLHKKELVLNADDTSNILSAVDMIRSISDTIDLNAHSASGFLSNLFGSIVPSRGQDTLEQSVTITAEFPNVQNRSEIEEAFDNLVNKAAQYANRKI